MSLSFYWVLMLGIAVIFACPLLSGKLIIPCTFCCWSFFEFAFSVIQFCATAFAYYAQATAAQEIFGHTLQSLRGIKYLYKSVTSIPRLLLNTLILDRNRNTHQLYKFCCRYNVFQIAFVVLAGLTFVYYAAFVSLLLFYLSFRFASTWWLETISLIIVRVGEEKNLVADSSFLLEASIAIKSMHLIGPHGNYCSTSHCEWFKWHMALICPTSFPKEVGKTHPSYI